MSTSVETISDKQEALARQAHRLQLLAYWSLRSEIELGEPRSAAVPYLWKWKDAVPLLLESADVVTIEEAERRALLFANPGLGGKPWMTSTLYGALQFIRPGESAACHRHTPSASRFILQGSGGFTTLAGEKCRMSPGDLIITPNWIWHDHGNDGVEETIWLDVLDVPIVERLDATFFELTYTETDPQSGEPETRTLQTITRPPDYSRNLYSRGGIAPKFVSRPVGQDSPLFVYKWETAREALERLRAYESDPYDGILVEYTNPVTGGPAMATMSFQMQLLRPGQRTLAHRHTTSSVYCAVQGEGSTVMNGARFEWSQNDVFVIPSWVWHEHANQSAQDAILYSVSDAPTIQKLGLYREQRRTPTGDVVTVRG